MKFTHGILILLLLLTAGLESGAASSPLSKGRWVKVRVEHSGVYRLPHSVLTEWGFDSPEDVRVVGYGSVRCAHSLNDMPDNIRQVATERRDDAIYFYAEGDKLLMPAADGSIDIHSNYYSIGSCYYVGVADGLPDLAPVVGHGQFESQLPPVTTHTDIKLHLFEEEMLGEGGVMFHSRSFSGASRTIAFDVTDIEGPVTIGIQCAGTSTAGGGMYVDFENNSHPRATISIPPVTDDYCLYTEPAPTIYSLITDEHTDSIHIKFSDASPGNSSYLGVRYAYMTCLRRNAVKSGGHIMGFRNLTAGTPIEFTGVRDRDIVVWDVTSPNEITACPVEISEDTALSSCCQTRGWTVLCVFEPSDNIDVPEYAGEVDTDDMAALESVTKADMLIITTDETYEEGIRLGEAHSRIQGLKTVVLRQQSIFDFFSSGAAHPAAVRQLCRRLANSSERPLRYLCLLGTASRDPRGISTATVDERLICYHSESYADCHICTSTNCSDSYFGIFPETVTPQKLSDLSSPVNIAIGRIPANNDSEARIYVDKAIAYLENPLLSGDYTHSVILSCKGDENYHLNACESSANDILTFLPGATITKAYPQLYPVPAKRNAPVEGMRKIFYKALAGRPHLYAFIGHGSLDALSYSNHLLSDEHHAIYGSMPFAVLGTCRGCPTDIENLSMGKAMIIKSSGPPALVTSTREVPVNISAFMVRLFTRTHFQGTSEDCWGDLWQRTMTAAMSAPAQTRAAALLFNFIGDPALPTRIPALNVNLVGKSENPTGGSPAHLKGTVTHPDGTVASDFSGTLFINFYDAPVTRRTYIHDASEKSVEITSDYNLTGSFAAEVRNGNWEAYLTMPVMTREAPGRVTFEARSDDGLESAYDTADIAIAIPVSSETPTADSVAPTINILFDDVAKSGYLCESAPMVKIRLTDDDSGILFNPSVVGTVPTVCIDGQPFENFASLLRPVKGGMEAEFIADGLDCGEHYVNVRACDTAGNTSERSASFTILSHSIVTTLTVDNHLVRDAVEFSLTSSSSIPLTGRLLITDNLGQTACSIPVSSFPLSWDLRVSPGSDTFVADGTYHATFIYTDGLRHDATPETTFTIIRKK